MGSLRRLRSLTGSRAGHEVILRRLRSLTGSRAGHEVITCDGPDGYGQTRRCWSLRPLPYLAASTVA